MVIIHQRAMTLLETLFVLVVISVITLAGVNFMAGRAEELKVTQTAHAIQSWLSAAQNYYLDNNYIWPASPNALVPFYITADKLTNPWKSNYLWATGFAPTAKRMGITTTVPSNAIARKLAAKLIGVSPNPPTNKTVTVYTTAVADAPPKTMQLVTFGLSTHDISHTGGLKCPHPDMTMHSDVAQNQTLFSSTLGDISCLAKRAFVKTDNGRTQVVTHYQQAIWVFGGCFSEPAVTNSGIAMYVVWCCPPPGPGVQCPRENLVSGLR